MASGTSEPDTPLSVEDVDHPRFTLWESRAQTAGSLLIGVLIVLAAFGLFGNGPLSETTASNDGLRVEYPRFLRREAIETLTIHVPAEAASEGTIALQVDRDYIEAFRIRETVPEPSSVQVANDALVFEFELADGPAEAVIVFSLSPARPGLHSGAFALEQGPTVRIRQFVYP